MLHAFFNGFNNSGTLVAAPISTRSLPPRAAIAIAIAAEFAGPFLFGFAVAATIGRDLLEVSAITMNVLLAAMAAVILWNASTWFFGIPSSSSHALAGGLIGSALVAARTFSVFKMAGLLKVLGGLMVGPLLGFACGYLLLKILLLATQNATPGVNIVFRQLQSITTAALALGHGTNDGQKSIGLITLGLVVLRIQPDFVVPSWVILSVATAMALGVAVGGYRIIRTLGAKIYKLRPVHGFAAQASAAVIVLASALSGLPVATTHITATTIVGVGAADRVRAVHWEVAGQIMTAWFITIPMVAVLAGIFYVLLGMIA